MSKDSPLHSTSVSGSAAENGAGRSHISSQIGIELVGAADSATGDDSEMLKRRLNRAPTLSFPAVSKPLTVSEQFQKFWSKTKKHSTESFGGYSWMDWLGFVLPCVKWLRTYRIREYLLSDLIAGLTVGVMIVPQSMSYGNLAGLPAVYGLYGSWLPLWFYAFFGTSKQLGVGPVAVTSLLIGDKLPDVIPGSRSITNHNQPSAADQPIQDAYNHAAIQLSFLVACFYTGVGVLRLGFLTNFLSKSVIGGFTSGAAIIIGLSQVKYILGYGTRPGHDRIQEYISIYIDEVTNFKWQEFVMGTSLLALLIFMKELGKKGGKKYKWLMFARPLGPITAVVIAMLAVAIGNLDQKGIRTVGKIPEGLPPCTISWWAPMDKFSDLLPIAAIVMIVDLMESTSIARAVAAKNRYELVPNQEIIGLGIANFAGSAFNAYTTTGSFSRTAVNNEVGAKSPLAGFVTGTLVLLVLLLLTPVFKYMPYNVMGAMILSAVSGLFEYEQAIYLFRTNKLDFLVWCASFLITIFVSVEIGLGVAIGLAVLFVIYESAFPHMAVLGRISDSNVYRNIKQYPEAQIMAGILIVRIDAPIYFANYQYIKDRIQVWEKRAEATALDAGTKLTYVIFDLTPVSHVDASGQLFLMEMMDMYKKRNVQLVLCNPSKKVAEAFDRIGFLQHLGREWVFVCTGDAVSYCQHYMAEHGLEIKEFAAGPSVTMSRTS